MNHTPINHLLDEKTKLSSAHRGGSPEGEPRPIATESSEPTSEGDIAVEQDPSIEDAEVKEYVKAEQSIPEIHPQLKKAGLRAIEHESLDTKHKIELPISDEDVMEGLHKPVTSSWRWLAEIAFFMLKHAHLSLKKIHGHVVRVMQN